MKRWPILIALLLPVTAVAQVRPEPGPGDPRIQSVLYDPDQIVQLQVTSGYQLTVEFAPDERIENVAVGDSSTWQVTPNKRGDHLFIKLAQPGGTTNLTVVTDARSYLFELMPAYGGLAPYAVRFRYPAPAIASVAEAAEEGRYRLSGAKPLRPNAISDDGAKTYITWPPDATLPAVFALDAEGKEVVVDGGIRDGRYVVDDVNNTLVFRRGKTIATATRVPQRPPR
jgi:type IV secretion system protein VirB9